MRYYRDLSVGLILMLLFLLWCLIYYFTFSTQLDFYAQGADSLGYAINAHDHLIYLGNVQSVTETAELVELANDKGIALIYRMLASLTPFSLDFYLADLALFFNSVVIIACYLAYSQICERLSIGIVGKVTFFANTSLIYFSQLINKDLLTIFAFLISVLIGVRYRYFLLLTLPFFALVRLQLAIYIFIYIFLAGGDGYLRRGMLVYVATSVLAGVMSASLPIIGEESLGGGFSAYLVELNRDYFVGYLFFNPVRLIQYCWDAAASFYFLNESGGVDYAKLLRLPQLILVGCLIARIFLGTRSWSFLKDKNARPLVVAVASYFLTWLMNPTVNARYVMLITPVIVLLLLYVVSKKQRLVVS